MERTEGFLKCPSELVNSLYAKLTDYFPDWYFRTHHLEKRAYEALGIRIFKKFIPNGGDYITRKKRKNDPNFYEPGFTLSGHSRTGMSLYATYTKIHEVTHLLGTGLFLGFTLASANMDNKVLFTIFGVGSIANAYCVMLQRYNRGRISRILEK